MFSTNKVTRLSETFLVVFVLLNIWHLLQRILDRWVHPNLLLIRTGVILLNPTHCPCLRMEDTSHHFLNYYQTREAVTLLT